jgi:hypothetical protein
MVAKTITALKDKKGSARNRGYSDETIELALNWNLDPHKPGQSWRALPHGTGKMGHGVGRSHDRLGVGRPGRGRPARRRRNPGGRCRDEQALCPPATTSTVALATLQMILIWQKKGGWPAYSVPMRQVVGHGRGIARRVAIRR